VDVAVLRDALQGLSETLPLTSHELLEAATAIEKGAVEIERDRLDICEHRSYSKQVMLVRFHRQRRLGASITDPAASGRGQRKL
jgi:hypothetical protein